MDSTNKHPININTYIIRRVNRDNAFIILLVKNKSTFIIRTISKLYTEAATIFKTMRAFF